MDLAKLGHRLRLYRERDALGLREAARRIGVSPTYLSRIERGQVPRPPSERILRALAHLYDDEPAMLLHLAGRIPEDVQAMLLADVHWTRALLRAHERAHDGRSPKGGSDELRP